MPEFSQHPKTYKNKDMEKYHMKRRIADKLNREAREGYIDLVSNHMIELIRLVGNLSPDPDNVKDIPTLIAAAQKIAMSYNKDLPDVNAKYNKRPDLK